MATKKPAPEEGSAENKKSDTRKPRKTKKALKKAHLKPVIPSSKAK